MQKLADERKLLQAQLIAAGIEPDQNVRQAEPKSETTIEEKANAKNETVSAGA
jgi:hypothetical protein